MERRNLDFEIELTRDQWAGVGERADALGAEEGGFAWRDDRFDEIRVFLRPADAPPLWRDFVGNDETYGAPLREVARFRFNDGRPYADVELPESIVEPVYSEDEGETMRAELEDWIRGKWHELLRESGLHYDRGHLPQG